MKILLIVSSLFLILLIQSCNTTEPIPVNENIKITEINAAVIEAYLNIQIENPSSDREVVIERNGQQVISFTASKTDTAITDTGLTENTLYKYKAKLTENGKVIGESSEISVTTMLPTSHNFTWQTFTFGEHSSSSLYDVAIIDENNIWAVGEIYIKDSSGEIDPHPYNAVHWDGTKWELKRILFYTVCGQQNRTPYPAKSIFAFNENDIWISAGDQIVRWDGNTEKVVICLPFSFYINKLWGSSPNSVYAVGNGGNIAYYNGTSWQKVESGTDWDIYDVFGKDDISSIYFTATSILTDESILIKFDKNKFKDIKHNGTFALYSVWYNTINKIYLAGSYFFIYENSKWQKISELSNQSTTSVKGTGFNDIVVVGTKGIINHFNGLSWLSYQTAGEYSAVDIKRGTVVTIGSSYTGEALIAIGKRN